MSGKEQGLITTKMRILLAVYIDPRASHKEIAKRLGADERNIGRHLESLVRQGLLEAEPAGRRNQYQIGLNGQITPESGARIGQLLKLLAESSF